MELKMIDLTELTIQEEVRRVSYFLHIVAPKVSIVFPYTLPIADAMYIQKNDTIYVDYQTLQMEPLEIVLMYVIKAVRTKYQLAQYNYYYTDTRLLHESPDDVHHWGMFYKYYADSKNPESFEKYIKSDAHVDCQAFSIFMFDVLHEQSLRIPSLNKIRVMRKIRDKNCALFIWATMPCLPEVFKVIEAWGFKYKTCAFTWIKTKKDGQPLSGMGSYTKANAELCLLAMRGHIKSIDKTVPQVLMHPRLGHSVKPDEIMRRIERLFGSETTKIELFARRQVEGWDRWGNEA